MLRQRIANALLSAVLVLGMCVPAPVLASEPVAAPEGMPPEEAPLQLQAADVGHIVSIAGAGTHAVVDGVAPFDADDTPGNDSSASNLRVRSFDTIAYNIDVTAEGNSGKKVENARMGFEFCIPYDEELVLDQSAMNWALDWAETTAEVGGVTQRVYTMYREMPKSGGFAIPGGCSVEFVLKVGAKKQGDTIQPTIASWCEGNSERMEHTPSAVTVTTKPSYNIALKQRSFSQVNTYSFNGNAYNPAAGTLQGMLASYGFAVQLYNSGDLNKGIRGIELPQGEISFDIDLASTYTVDGTGTPNPLTGDLAPLLYAVFANGATGQRCEDLPYTSGTYTALEGRYCFDSGNVVVEQVGTTLHVTVKDYRIDRNQFPTASANGAESYVAADGTYQVGNISVFRFDVVQPTVHNDSSVQTQYGQNGTVQIDAEVKNLQARSETGASVTTDSNLHDNEVSAANHMNGQGNYNHEIYFSDDVNWTGGTSEVPDTKIAGNDSAVIGAPISLTAIYSESNVSGTNVGAHTVAYDQLIKFDNAALEIDESRTARWDNPTAAAKQVLYVGKAGGWDHAGKKPWEEGYDAEMKAAKEETAGLHYYESLEALAAAGDTCVGLLVRWRGCHTDEATDHFSQLYQFRLKVRNDTPDVIAALMEHASAPNPDAVISTYMVTASTNAWLASDLDTSAVAAYLGKTAQDLTLADYQSFASAAANEGAFTTTSAAATSTTVHTVNIDRDDDYVKAKYGASGYAGGDTAGFLHGDTLYVVPYTMQVVKRVAQAGTEGDDKQTYDVDLGQRTVDFVVAPSIKMGQRVDAKSDWTTTVTLTDTLPAGLSFVPGSAYLGGTYTEQTPAAGVVEGGQATTPVAVTNPDGTTTLTWTISAVKVQDGALPQLHYSCTIGTQDNPTTDVVNNQQLTTSVTVSTPEDLRPASTENGNMSQEGITVVKLASFNLLKTGTAAIELDGVGTFDMVVNNSSSSPRTNLVAIDFLPVNGVAGAQFVGTYALLGLKLNVEALAGATGDIKFYYTTDANVVGKTAADFTREQIEGTPSVWSALAFDQTTGEISGWPEGVWPCAIAYIDNELPAMKTAHLTMTYKGNAARVADKLVNRFSEEKLTVSAQAEAYARSISGTAWLDANHDGVMDSAEKRLGGIVVKLMASDGVTQIKHTDGTDFTATTDDNGYYQFGVSNPVPTDMANTQIIANLLRSGDYQVVFDLTASGSPYASSGYKVTTRLSGAADTASTNNKATAVNESATTQNAAISGIHAASIAEMQTANTHYATVPNLNAGFYDVVDVPVAKMWEDANDQDGLRPDSLIVSLLADGTPTGQTLTLTGTNNSWSGTFQNLPKYHPDGTAIAYTVTEPATPGYNDGAAATPTGNATTGYTFANTHTPRNHHRNRAQNLD